MKEYECRKEIVLAKRQKRIVNFNGAILSDLNFEDLNLIGADFSNCVLNNVSFKNSNLGDAIFEECNMKNINFMNCNLIDSKFSGSIVSACNFKNSDVFGADFEGSVLEYNNFEVAKNYYTFLAYDTSKRIIHCFKHKNTWMIQAGCFWDSLDELEDKVNKHHLSKVYLANIKILEII